MRRRLGESPGAVTLYGPADRDAAIAGCVPRLRMRGRSVASSRASVRCTNATPTSSGPAFSGSGNSSGAVPPARRRPRRPPRPPPARRSAAERSRSCHALAVDRDLELRAARAARAGELHLDGVGAVDRELAADRNAAARAERQLVDALVLRVLGIELVDVHHHRHRRIADREAADLPRRVEIALHGARRDEQQVGDVVEAAADVVGRQQVVDAHFPRQRVEREQIAHRVAVLGAAQAMRERQLAEMRARGRGAIELGFEERGHARRRWPRRDAARRPAASTCVRSLRTTFSQRSALGADVGQLRRDR